VLREKMMKKKVEEEEEKREAVMRVAVTVAKERLLRRLTMKSQCLMDVVLDLYRMHLLNGLLHLHLMPLVLNHRHPLQRHHYRLRRPSALDFFVI
jgi:hypothetical protein